MELTVGVREVVAWTLAVASLSLFLYTIIRNPTRQYYLAVQGLLVACHKKSMFYSSQAQGLKDSKSNTTSLNEAQKIYEFVANDYAVLTQHIFGVMKSIQPNDLPVDVVAFLTSSVPVSEHQSIAPETKAPPMNSMTIGQMANGNVSNRSTPVKPFTR
ncbi:MAG: hypothetical protein AAFR31_17810 [Cyanobacteria bacterium J06627_8]